MDVSKLLNGGCKMIDCDPASDCERDDNLISVAFGGAGSGGQIADMNGKKKKGKAKLITTKPSEDMSIETIIETKPSKKVVEKYIKMRIDSILDEDSD